MESYTLYIDGASVPNPGKSAIGIVLLDQDGIAVEQFGGCIEDGTNNRAEYSALIKGLSLAAKHFARSVNVRSDSELVVYQMGGRYKVRDVNLRELHSLAKKMCLLFERVRFEHVPREKNKLADHLAAVALKVTA